MIIHVLVQTFTTRGKQLPILSPTFVSWLPKSYFQLLTPGDNINGATLPVSQPEQGGASLYYNF